MTPTDPRFPSPDFERYESGMPIPPRSTPDPLTLTETKHVYWAVGKALSDIDGEHVHDIDRLEVTEEADGWHRLTVLFKVVRDEPEPPW